MIPVAFRFAEQRVAPSVTANAGWCKIIPGFTGNDDKSVSKKRVAKKS